MKLNSKEDKRIKSRCIKLISSMECESKCNKLSRFSKKIVSLSLKVPFGQDVAIPSITKQNLSTPLASLHILAILPLDIENDIASIQFSVFFMKIIRGKEHLR